MLIDSNDLEGHFQLNIRVSVFNAKTDEITDNGQITEYNDEFVIVEGFKYDRNEFYFRSA